MKQPPPHQEVTASVVIVPRVTTNSEVGTNGPVTSSSNSSNSGSGSGKGSSSHSQQEHQLQQHQQQVQQVQMVKNSLEQSKGSPVVSSLGANQHNLLSVATDEPFERAILPSNHVPYYINHAGELTQWDHPVMSQLMASLMELNEIKFSAYRTGLKLKAVQKTLSLDAVPLDLLVKTFDRFGLRAQNDKLLSVPEMISCLQCIFETVASLAEHSPNTPGTSGNRKNSTSKLNNSQTINVSLAIDLSLNWILNLYDTASRTGYVRVLSFKVALVALCDSSLLDKYKFMFRLIADTSGFTNARRFGLLLHDLIQIPRFLGEAAYFGGSNIEPSVRSCFTPSNNGHKKVTLKSEIDSSDFLCWLQLEPQSLVWLPVMHRLIASDSVIHQVKCNICKAFPIHGLRYRCLRCFNFDCCQTCFLTDRISSKHNSSHPMQEYCLPTSSGKDLSDFSRILRNKLVNSKRSPRYGYLPVQTVVEGDDLHSPTVSTVTTAAFSSPSHNFHSISSPNSPLLRLIHPHQQPAHHPLMSMSVTSVVATPPPVPPHMSASHNQIANLAGQHKSHGHLNGITLSHSQNIASAINNSMHHQATTTSIFLPHTKDDQKKVTQILTTPGRNTNSCV